MTPSTKMGSRPDLEAGAIVEPGSSADKMRGIVPLATNFDDLLRVDDAPDETADDIIHAVQEWRGVQSQRGLK